MDYTKVLVELIVAIPAIIAALATWHNGRRLKRVSERVKTIQTAQANGHNGAPTGSGHMPGSL